MGSFFLTSKKASATLVFLVISIIIVSSGVIIVHEVEKSNNENNIAGTGLVLLDNEQNNLDALSDSSGEGTKLFTFGDSGRKTSSKKSSGGGGSSGEELSTVSEVSNDLILPEINETSDNQTFVNDTEEEDLNSSESFVNDTEEENLNSSESTNISVQFSDSQIFEQNGTTYIMRDGAVYALASSEQIRFNPPLPSSICVGEKIDIKLTGSLSPVLNLNGIFACVYADSVGADIELKIMEDDLIGDDLIASKTFHVYVDCDNPKVDYSKVFENVDLSSQFGGTADQSRIEVYGLVKLTSNNLHNIEYSTSTYDVNKADCDCLSGPCCDLSSRPYEFKPYGSSCGTCKACDSFGSCSKTPSDDSACGIIDCSNWYVKTGTQSPTTNQWCYNKKDITSNRCEAFGNCKDSNTADCGGQSNDQLKYYCGVCKFIRTGDCTGTTRGSCSNYYKHVSCGTNSECDGFGTCVTCTTHSYTNCWDNDVYYYDACDNREEKKLPDCGENSYTDWWLSSYCVGDNLYVPRTYYNRGCQNRVCYVDSLDENVFVKTCANGCSNGGCIIECSSDSDCGENYWNYFCGDGSWGIVDGNAYKMYVERKCKYPGSDSSYCYSNYGNPILVEICLYGCSNGSCIVECSSDSDCPEDSYSNNYCSNDDVYHNFTDRGCLDGACFENTTEQFVQECGEGGCSDGECLYVECYNHTMCDPDNDPDNNYVGDPWCSNDDVWQNYVNYTCNYPGTGNSYCSNSTAPDLKENCGFDYCENWGGNYCNLDDVYHERTCHDKGCSDGACFDNIDTEEEKVQECGISEYTGSNYCYDDDVYRDYITRTCSYSSCTSSTSKKKIEDCTNGCISGRCLVEVCKTICNFGTCYEYCVWQ